MPTSAVLCWGGGIGGNAGIGAGAGLIGRSLCAAEDGFGCLATPEMAARRGYEEAAASGNIIQCALASNAAVQPGRLSAATSEAHKPVPSTLNMNLKSQSAGWILN